MARCSEILDISVIGAIIPKCERVETFVLDFRECEKLKSLGVLVNELAELLIEPGARGSSRCIFRIVQDCGR